VPELNDGAGVEAPLRSPELRDGWRAHSATPLTPASSITPTASALRRAPRGRPDDE